MFEELVKNKRELAWYAHDHPEKKIDDSVTYVIIDTETTGLDPKECHLLEVSAIRYAHGEELGRFQSYIKSDAKIPRKITKMTGIQQADIENAPPADEVAKQLSAFIGDDIVTGYNVRFDIGFLQARLGIKIPGKVFDTRTIAQHWIDNAPDYKLQTMKEYLGLDIESHNATADCITTQAVIIQCLDIVKTFWETLTGQTPTPEELNQREQRNQERLMNRERIAERKQKQTKEIEDRIIGLCESTSEGILRADLIKSFPKEVQEFVKQVLKDMENAERIAKVKVDSRIFLRLP